MVDIATAHARSLRAPGRPRRTLHRGPHGRPGTPPGLPVSEQPATIEDWLRIPEEKRAELIHGRIVLHAFPNLRHGHAQAQLGRLLWPYNRRRKGGGGGGPSANPELGGWWLSQEVDIEIADVGCRPDVVGWRRDKHARAPQPDARGVVTETPDFLCEVLSASTARYDQGEKRDAYFRGGVPHYWLLDPDLRTLTVLERVDRGYLIVRVAGPGETVRAAPFEGVEIPLDELFLDEEGELPVQELESARTIRTREAKSAAPAAAEKAEKRPRRPPR